MTTPVIAPEGVPYPITIDELIAPIGSHVNRGDRLFAYKFWYLVEVASDDMDDAAMQHVSSESGNKHAHKIVRESIEYFDAPFEGDIMCWNVDEGDEIASPNQTICEIKRPCNHDIVYGGLCTICGKEVGDFDQVDANLTISHTDTDLKISALEAKRFDSSLKQRLRKDRKLVLVVDLDQTVIHCGVDPTIGEWKNDTSNPNYETLKDVKSFVLEEENLLPMMFNLNGNNTLPPPRQCRYYVKVRPGLKEFFEHIAPLYEMHIYTMATRAYALEIAKIIDPNGSLFGNRILSRDENGSFTHKSLERLFPTDQSMVVVIDDRGDVWNWCPNLIQIVPYNFFVGVGDINSNFLPKQQATMMQIGRRHNAKKEESEGLLTDIMDTEKRLKEKIDEEVKRQEEKLHNQLINKNDEATGTNESKETITKKLEYSASLEVQQQNRPLAALQKHLHNQRLLVDDDDELYYLKNTLSLIHARYYEIWESNPNDERGGGKMVADISTLVPNMKMIVFQNCYFVFSGLIPLGTDVQRADIVIWTSMFGARTSADIDENTTHLVTKNPGTYKARLAKSFNSEIKIVHPDWVFECLAKWEHVDEKPYLLIVDQPLPESEVLTFKEKLKRRKLEYDEQRKQRETLLLKSHDQVGHVDLFEGGSSWLDDNEDDIPRFDDDEDDEDGDDSDSDDVKLDIEDQGFHDSEKVILNSDSPTFAESDPHEKPVTHRSAKKRSLQEPLEDDMLKRSRANSTNLEDEDSDLEEELLNMLDDE